MTTHVPKRRGILSIRRFKEFCQQLTSFLAKIDVELRNCPSGRLAGMLYRFMFVNLAGKTMQWISSPLRELSARPVRFARTLAPTEPLKSRTCWRTSSLFLRLVTLHVPLSTLSSTEQDVCSYRRQTYPSTRYFRVQPCSRSTCHSSYCTN